LEKSCAEDIKQYCSTVTRGEGRMIYCMQAHEDKTSPGCSYDLEDIALALQASNDALKEAANACRADIAAKWSIFSCPLSRPLSTKPDITTGVPHPLLAFLYSVRKQGACLPELFCSRATRLLDVGLDFCCERSVAVEARGAVAAPYGLRPRGSLT
jgi:hypothetical protein